MPPVGWKERWEGEQDVAKGEKKSSSPARLVKAKKSLLHTETCRHWRDLTGESWVRV